MSQRELAQKLETSREMIDYYERRAANPSQEFIQQAAQALKVSVAELLGSEPKASRGKPGQAPPVAAAPGADPGVASQGTGVYSATAGYGFGEGAKGLKDRDRRKDMNPVAERILAEALKTPPEDRARIAERLIASLDIDTDSEVESAWQQEVQQRLRAVESGEVTLLSWEEVCRKLRGGSDARD